MKWRWIGVLALAGGLAIVSSCGKPGSSAASGASAGTGTAAASDEQVAVTIGELTQSVRKFAAEQRQAPKTLDELVAKGYLERTPAAPKGKRYAINQRLEVYLADQ